MTIGRPCSAPSFSPRIDRGLGGVRRRARLIGRERHDRVELRVEALDHGEMRVEHLDAG